MTVIDYYSRYLLSCHLIGSYCASEVLVGLRLAREEAERIHGPLASMPFLVTDNGSSFIARRFQQHMKDQFRHARIRYRTPRNWVFWNGFTARSKRRRCTGVCMTVRAMHVHVWRNSKIDTTGGVLIGRWYPKKEATR